MNEHEIAFIASMGLIFAGAAALMVVAWFRDGL